MNARAKALVRIIPLVVVLLCSANASAQEQSSESGWIWRTNLYGNTYPSRTLPPDSTGASQGSVRSNLFSLGNVFGYQVNRHVSFFGDLPVYFVHFCRKDSSGVETCGNNNGIGDVGASAQLFAGAERVFFVSTGTVRFPSGDEQKGLGAGITTASWANTLSFQFGRTAPFASLLLANSLQPTATFQRPFTSKGFVAELSGGLEQQLHRHFRVGASAYRVFPSGEQTTFGRFQRSSLLGGIAPGLLNNPRLVPTEGETTGTADLTRDYGGSIWMRFPVHRQVEFQVAYTRSVLLNLNTISYGVSFNFSPLLRGD